ncbi:unnamed protein product [Ilex paraguariensis]|uniref:Uncharacterized protein n=1 Tax=Ilex paraguariensis TaxID=185542 RepID=A0ABC8TZF3_9AQUA
MLYTLARHLLLGVPWYGVIVKVIWGFELPSYCLNFEGTNFLGSSFIMISSIEGVSSWSSMEINILMMITLSCRIIIGVGVIIVENIYWELHGIVVRYSLQKLDHESFWKYRWTKLLELLAKLVELLAKLPELLAELDGLLAELVDLSSRAELDFPPSFKVREFDSY